MTATEAPARTFPSVEWFEALVEAAKDDEPRYRRLGVVDCVFALRIGERAFRLTFEDFGCTGVEEWDGSAPVDFVVSASVADWNELVGHIRARGSADPDHTLNSLVLSGDRFVLSGDDQLGIDVFYRFNATLQAFVEEARRVPTVLASA